MRLLLADGGHDPTLAGALLPDALRWLWRARPTTPADDQHHNP
jgi:enterochelin esterase family protein